MLHNQYQKTLIFSTRFTYLYTLTATKIDKKKNNNNQQTEHKIFNTQL